MVKVLCSFESLLVLAFILTLIILANSIFVYFDYWLINDVLCHNFHHGKLDNANDTKPHNRACLNSILFILILLFLC